MKNIKSIILTVFLLLAFITNANAWEIYHNIYGTSPTINTPSITGKVTRNAITVDDDDCTSEQGKYWFDTTDSAFEFCNANSGTPVVLGGGTDFGTLTDGNVCRYDQTGTEIDCNLTTDGSGDCLSGSVCLGDHTHSGYLSSVASDSDWTVHGSYPTGCTNQLITAIGDTLTCSSITSAMLPQTGLTDEYCLTYEATGTTMEWQACEAALGDITTVGACTSSDCGIEGGTDIFPFIYEGTANTFETQFVVTDPTVDRVITYPDETGTVCTTGSVCTGYVATDADLTSIAGGVTGIVKGAGNGNGYSAAVADTDYDSSVTNELPTAGTYIDVSGTEVAVDLTEITDATWGTSADTSQVWTWDTGAGTDPNVTITDSSFTFNKQVIAINGIQSGSSATPTVVWKDSDATDGDENSTMGVNCTDVGSGTEDCDITLSTQIAGAITSVMSVDADGNTNFSLPVSFGTAGVKFTGDGDGAITLLGLGNGSDEDLTINLDDTANNVVLSSSTGVTDISLSAINMVTTGTISGGIPSTTDNNGQTLTAALQYGYMHWATGAGTTALVTAVAGMNFCIYSTTAAAVVVNPADADIITLNGLALAAGDSITSASAAGDFICLVSQSNGNWATLGRSGTWTDSN